METEKIKVGTRLKSFIGQCNRVWYLLKKPNKEEFTTVAKVSAIGLGVVGGMGFLIAVIMLFIHI